MPTIREILREAAKAGASDVHITAGIPPRMRVNGVLAAMPCAAMLPADTLGMLLEIMTETQRNRFEEQGEYDMSFTDPELGRFRVNAYKQRGSVALAVRLVGAAAPSQEELGLPPSVAQLYQLESGLVLAAGPAGGGKSTTLAAIVDRINNTRAAHVITLEDPIEYLHQHKLSIVNQREIGLDTYSYANSLKAALREDPDVILVGELNDYETIGMAMTAAETGHLVLSALPAAGVVNAVERLVGVFPSDRQQQARIQAADVLEAVFSQQLVRAADGTGREAEFEVLRVTSEARSYIRSGKTGQLVSFVEKDRQR